MGKITLFDRIRGKDILLGKLIAREAMRSESPGNCPSLEKIADLAEGLLAEQDRDGVISHLNHCSHCYKFYLEAATLHNKHQLSNKIKSFFKVAIPVAATASVVIYIGLSVKIGLPGNSFFMKTAQVIKNMYRDTEDHEMAFHEKADKTGRTSTERLLAEDIKGRKGIESLTAENIAFQVSSAGAETKKQLFIESKFASRGQGKGVSELENRNRSVFILGMLLVDLEIANSGDDREQARKTLHKIKIVLDNHSWASNLSDYFSKLATDLHSSEIRKASSFAEVFFSNEGTNGYLKLGEWTAGARISLSIGSKEFFKAYPFNTFKDVLQTMQLSEPARKSLLNIEQLVASDLPSEAEIISLRKEVDTLISIMR